MDDPSRPSKINISNIFTCVIFRSVFMPRVCGRAHFELDRLPLKL